MWQHAALRRTGSWHQGAIHASIQCANTNNTMRFPDEGIHTAASMGDPPPHTEPPDLGTHPTVNTPNATTVNSHTQLDPEVHFLTDARNGFGELSHMAMLWEVWHQWPAGSRFAYNLYRHECRLILREPPGTKPAFLLSREGVMQGCVWGMVLYGIGLMPLMKPSGDRTHPSSSPIMQTTSPSKARPPALRTYSTCSAITARVWDTSLSRRNAGSSALLLPNHTLAKSSTTHPFL